MSATLRPVAVCGRCDRAAAGRGCSGPGSRRARCCCSGPVPPALPAPRPLPRTGRHPEGGFCGLWGRWKGSVRQPHRDCCPTLRGHWGCVGTGSTPVLGGVTPVFSSFTPLPFSMSCAGNVSHHALIFFPLCGLLHLSLCTVTAFLSGSLAVVLSSAVSRGGGESQTVGRVSSSAPAWFFQALRGALGFPFLSGMPGASCFAPLGPKLSSWSRSYTPAMRQEALALKAFGRGDIFLPTQHPNVAAEQPFCALHSEAMQLRVSGAGRVPRSAAKVPMGSALRVNIWICFRMLRSARPQGSQEIPAPEQGFVGPPELFPCLTWQLCRLKVGHVNLTPVHFM